MANGDKKGDCCGNGREREVVYVQPGFAGEPDDEIDLLELWSIIWSGKWFIIGFVALATIAAAFVSFYLLPVTYKSEVVLQTRGDAGPIENYLDNRVLADLKSVQQKITSDSELEVSRQGEWEHYSFVKDQNFGCVQGRIQVILSSKKGGWTNGSAIGYSQTKDWRCRA